MLHKSQQKKTFYVINKIHITTQVETNHCYRLQVNIKLTQHVILLAGSQRIQATVLYSKTVSNFLSPTFYHSMDTE